MVPAFIANIWAAFAKQIVIGVAVLALGLAVWLHGYARGKDNVQAKWDAAVAKEVARGDKARADARRAVAAGRLRHGADPWNRNR